MEKNTFKLREICQLYNYTTDKEVEKDCLNKLFGPIGPGTIIEKPIKDFTANEVAIGANCHIGPNSKFVGDKIIIEDNVLAFSNVTFSNNTFIHSNSVIAPGSTIDKEISSGEVWAYVPTKEITEKLMSVEEFKEEGLEEIDFLIMYKKRQLAFEEELEKCALTDAGRRFYRKKIKELKKELDELKEQKKN